jgi:hypothetical protein
MFKGRFSQQQQDDKFIKYNVQRYISPNSSSMQDGMRRLIIIMSKIFKIKYLPTAAG